jgi:hypothetical protein
MKIGFLCDLDLPNYKNDIEAYRYLHGRHSATGYYYWMLRNHGMDVHMVSPDDDLTKFDIIVYHFDNRDTINFNAYKTVQVVTDRPYVKGTTLYVAANRGILEPVKDIETIKRYGVENTLNTWIEDKSRWHFIHYPPTFNIKKCKPVFPPRRFKFVGRNHTMIPEILEQSFIDKCRTHNIDLIFDFENDNNAGDEDVYFCVRRMSHLGGNTKLDCNSGKYGHRTANRLYQAWYMNTPGIFNMSPEMAGLRDSELDFLVANNKDEFLAQAIRLTKDKDLFYSMVEHCKTKTTDNPYYDIQIVVQQWQEAFRKLDKY